MFTYKNSQLGFTQQNSFIPFSELTKLSNHPFYVYNLNFIEDRITHLLKSFKDLKLSPHFAVKSNTNPHVLKKIVDSHCGFDVVSGGELDLALSVGCKSENISSMTSLVAQHSGTLSNKSLHTSPSATVALP